MLAFAAHPSRRRFAPPQDEGGEVRHEGSGRRSSAKAKKRGVPDGVTAQVSESICRSALFGTRQVFSVLGRSCPLNSHRLPCLFVPTPPPVNPNRSLHQPLILRRAGGPSRRMGRLFPSMLPILRDGALRLLRMRLRGVREERGRWSSGGGGGRRGVGPTTGCIYMRMRSAFGSNSGSLMMVALRRSPRISISKAPSCVFVASSEGIYPCARDFRR